MSKRIGYIIIAIVFFLPFYPASAAMQVPGELPKVKPLLPLPPNTQPNYSGNVNSSSSLGTNDSLGGGTKKSSDKNGDNGSINVPDKTNAESYSFSDAFFASSSFKSLAWILPVLLLFVFALWLIRRRGDK